MSPQTLTYSDARGLFRSLPPYLEENRHLTGRHPDDYGDVDHYQSGTGYLGQKPSKGVKGDRFYMKQIRDRYITEDLSSDVLSYRTDGVLGSEPGKTYDTEAEDATDEEAARQDAFEAWWDDCGVTAVLEDHADAIGTEERSVLRFRIIGQSDEEGTVDAADEAEALAQHIRIEQVGRDQARVHTDDETLQEVGVFVAAATSDDEGDRAEITYLDGEQRTMLRVIDNSRHVDASKTGFGRVAPPVPDAKEQGSTPLDLGGNLLLREDTGDLLITESVRSNQYALNTTRTWAHIVDEKAGFPELHLTDIDPPVDEDGKSVQPQRGPDTIQYHVSLPNATETLDGKQIDQSVNPNVQQFAGADTESLRADCDEAREAVYRGAKQLHRFISGDAAASGEARVQARADFVQDLRRLKKTMDKAGKWIMETAWALAEALCGSERTGATASFECVLDAGPITPAERTALVNAVNSGAMSLRRALSIMGVDDPEAEIDRIREELEDPITKGQAETKRIIESVAADQLFRQQQGGVASRMEQQRAAAGDSSETNEDDA